MLYIPNHIYSVHGTWHITYINGSTNKIDEEIEKLKTGLLKLEKLVKQIYNRLFYKTYNPYVLIYYSFCTE